MRLVSEDAGIRVVCGVNLYMLVAAFGARRKSGLDQMAETMMSAGRKAIIDMKSIWVSPRP
jgi:mannose/fructose-specific phosphotransferase system component IIA